MYFRETNLKVKNIVTGIQQQPNLEDISSIFSNLHCQVETSSTNLFDFHGKLTVNQLERNTASADGETPTVNATLTHQNILLRGSSIENTAWVYGLVIYCGKECRVMKNLRYLKFLFILI